MEVILMIHKRGFPFCCTLIVLVGIGCCLSGCSPGFELFAPANTKTPSPVYIENPQDIIGTWYGIRFEGMYQRFYADGTCQTALTKEKLDSNPNVECVYSIDGTKITITTLEVSGLPPCQDAEAIYEVVQLPTGNIEFFVVEDTCAPRRRTTAQEHEPVP
jgi:hypothetical protein